MIIYVKKNVTVNLPYFEGFTNVVRRILLKFNIGVYTYPRETIRNTLPQLKNTVDLINKPGAIYKIPFKDCLRAEMGKLRLTATFSATREGFKQIIKK